MEEHPPLPEPPRVGRRIILNGYQWAAIPILVLLPILGLIGVFGSAKGATVVDGERLNLRVIYPDRTRFGDRESAQFVIDNDSMETLAPVILRVDKGYVESYRGVSFTPSVTEVTDDHYVVDLGRMEPGESLVVAAELIPDSYWSVVGEAHLLVDDETDSSVELRTFVFP